MSENDGRVHRVARDLPLYQVTFDFRAADDAAANRVVEEGEYLHGPMRLFRLLPHGALLWESGQGHEAPTIAAPSSSAEATIMTVFGFYKDTGQVYTSTFQGEQSVATVIRNANRVGVSVVAVVAGELVPIDGLIQVAHPDPAADELPGDPDCPFCAGQGWANCQGDNSFLPREEDEIDLAETIQRCDVCEVFTTDQEAWVAARVAGWEIDDHGRVVSAPEGRHPMPMLSARAAGRL